MKSFTVCPLFLLIFLFSVLVFSQNIPSASAEGGTYTLYLKLGHFQGGTTFVEDRPLTEEEKAKITVEIWTQPTGPMDFGRKVTTGIIGSPISLSPGEYKASLKGPLPSPYNTTREVPLGCLSFSISSSQSTGITCTLQAYDENNLSNYDLPSAERPSGNTPPMIQTDSSLGSYQFVKNVLDITSDDAKSIVSTAFVNLYGKKIMLVGTRESKSGGYNQIRHDFKLLVYDITNSFNPQLLKENKLPSEKVSDRQKSMKILGGGGFGSSHYPMLVLDDLPFIFGMIGGERDPVFVKINPDWSLGEIQDFKVKNGDKLESYYLTNVFRGLDGKPYGLAFGENSPLCPARIIDLSSSPPVVVKEINESNDEFDFGFSYCTPNEADRILAFAWRAAKSIKVGNKLYLIVPVIKEIGRLHEIEVSWVSVFDFTNPSQPNFVGIWQASGLNNQVHFPDASEAENAKIYADAGMIEIDSLNGYFYDIFTHMYDFQNAVYMLDQWQAGKTNDFFKIRGPWRYRNGVIIRKLNENGEFEFVSRFTLCEKEGGVPNTSYSMYHIVTCGNSWAWPLGTSFDKAFYGMGDYIKSIPSAGIHAYNGLILMRDLSKSLLKGNFSIHGSPVVVGLMVGNELKIIPDNSNEFLKFKDSLKKTNFENRLKNIAVLSLRDAHLQQVDDKTFAIFQIHGSSIDVVKLTLKDPRPMPSDSNSQPPSPPSNQPPRQLNNLYRDIYNTLRYTKEVLMRILYGW